MSEYNHILRQALALDPTIAPNIKSISDIEQIESRIHRTSDVRVEVIEITHVSKTIPVKAWVPGAITHRVETTDGEFIDIQTIGGA